jgi:cytochrome c peroxidase/DNA-binding beta-propeller fold protein YncE
MRSWRNGGVMAGAALLGAASLMACSSGGSGSGAPAAASGTTGTVSAPTATAAPSSLASATVGPALPREGQALARSARGDTLYVAQQDTSSLHLVALPLDPARAPREVSLPGRPAQLVVHGERVLVTVRDPGLLLVMRPDAAAGLVEAARVSVPADAFGLALTRDGAIALVTSAWTHAVSAVDVTTAKVLWTVDVEREPRGITVTPDGKRAYVTHLMGPEITRIDDLGGPPRVTRVPLAVAPLRARSSVKEAATLAYAGVLSPDGARLFVPRQALNAEGKRSWNGQGVVDVLLTGDDTALAQDNTKQVAYSTPELEESRRMGTGRGPFRDLTFGGGFPFARDAFSAPRAAVYRASSRTLLVASEGTDTLVELDALAIEPAAHVLHRYRLRGRSYVPRAPLERAQVVSRLDGVLYTIALEDGRAVVGYDENKLLDGGAEGLLVGIERRKRGSAEVAIVVKQQGDSPGETKCGAPSGVALSQDERTAWVLCRSTWGVVEAALDPDKDTDRTQTITPKVQKLGEDPLPKEAALGRRLYYDGADGNLSGGVACAGCHPDGRDDGHVWQELTSDNEMESAAAAAREPCAIYLSTPILPFFFDMVFEWSLRYGAPRQTPMLAGRVAAKGPYGWRGKNPDLMSRVIRGSEIHGWTLPELFCGSGNMKSRALALAAFVRAGLVTPPREERPLTEQERRGKAVFEDPKTACASCHVPATGYTDRSVVPFAAPPPVFDKAGPVKSFEEEKDRMFKTPSLLFVGGTPPYFHDGTAATLEEVIEKNRDRMGKTMHLSAEDRAALAAFLKTL